MKKLFLTVTMVFFTSTAFASSASFENVGEWYWPINAKSIKIASNLNTFSNADEWYLPINAKSIKTASNLNTFSNADEWYLPKI